MDAPLYARRIDGRRVARAAAATATAVIAIWRTPKQRRLALAIAAAVLSAVAFARIAEDYLTNDPLARWDLTFARWLFGERSTIGTDFFRAVTFLGSPATVAAVAAVACVVLYRRRRLDEAALLPVVFAIAELLNVVLKLSFHRARPEVASVHLDTYSFPSGHAMMSTAVYGGFAYLAWSRVRGPRARVALVLGTAAFLALICFSRLYLGVHYLSDVLAGAAGGAFCLAVAVALQAIYGDRFARSFADSRADRLARRATRS
ncbi:MAG: phosphatase PAP2 family protein [Gaiellaceae bacterium]